MQMKYVNKLLTETDFLMQLEKLEQLEQQRSYCRHGLSHLLDTARIAWIENLEQHQGLEREAVYLAALLHDLGRILEYEHGIPHHQAGEAAADRLLAQIGCGKALREEVLKAVQGHRSQEETDGLAELIRWADKRSRNCFFCQEQSTCNWEQKKRNRTIEY